MGLAPRTSTVKLTIIFCSLVSIVYFFAYPTDTSNHLHLETIYTATNKIYDNVMKGKPVVFVQDFLETEIDGPVNLDPITFVCDSKTWNNSVVVQCTLPQDDVANVRNTFLNCVRYTIELGGVFILPKIMSRDKKSQKSGPGKEQDMSYFFDKQHFIDTVAEACPQLRLIDSINDLWDVPSVQTPYDLQPEKLTADFNPPGVLQKPEMWLGQFQKWLNDTISFSPTPDQPALIVLDKPFLQFPLTYDRGEFVTNFGRILRFREDVRRLAGNVLYALDVHFDLNLDPTKSIRPRTFYGAHLTGKDPLGLSYHDQVESLSQEAKSRALTDFYVSAMEPEDTIEFATDAARYNLSVATKESLLSTPGYEGLKLELNQLTLDQQAMVDYEVLLRSSFFSGARESVIAWNVAMKRHVVNGEGLWFIGNSMKAGDENMVGGPPFLDELSMILGDPKDTARNKASLWP